MKWKTYNGTDSPEDTRLCFMYASLVIQHRDGNRIRTWFIDDVDSFEEAQALAEMIVELECNAPCSECHSEQHKMSCSHAEERMTIRMRGD